MNRILFFCHSLMFCNVSWEAIGRVDFFLLFLKIPDTLLVIWNLLSSFYHNIFPLNLSRVHRKRCSREMCEYPRVHWITLHSILSRLSYQTFNVIARFRWIVWEFFVIRTNDAFSRDKRSASRCYVPFLAQHTRLRNDSAHIWEFIDNYRFSIEFT